MTSKNQNSVEETAVSMNKMEYEKSLPAITAIPDEAIIFRATIPPEVCSNEAEGLCRWAEQDKERLENAGLAPGKLESLQAAAGALRYANGEWISKKAGKTLWQQESPEAYDVRGKIIQALLYACSDKPDVVAKVHDATKGLNRVKLVQQLQNLNPIGKDHKEELEAIGFDMSLLDRASELSARMADILGEMKTGSSEEKHARKILLQAYTLCRNLMSDVRKCGKYLFPRNHERYAGYTSAYTRLKKNHKKEVTTDETTEISEAA